METVAVLLEDPLTVNGTRVALADLPMTRGRCTVRWAEPAGHHTPYQRGDRVRVALLGGDAAHGAIVVGRYGGVVPASPANLELHARGAGDLRLVAESGRVELGRGDGADMEALACHPGVAADLLSVQRQIDVIASILCALPAVGAVVQAALNAARAAGQWPTDSDVPPLSAGIDPPDFDTVAPCRRATGGAPAANVVALPEDRP